MFGEIIYFAPILKILKFIYKIYNFSITNLPLNLGGENLLPLFYYEDS